MSKLQAGLEAAKRAGGNGSAGVAAFRSSTGVTETTAKRILDAVFGKTVDRGASEQAMVSALANKLGVSKNAAQRALQQLETLGRGGVDPGTPGFAALAHSLGVSPNQLAAGLDAAKRSLAGHR